MTWNKNCLFSSVNGANGNAIEFIINKTELYVPIVTLSTNDEAKLLKQLNTGFKRSIHWDKYQTIYETKDQDNTYRRQLDGSFQGVNRLFALAFNNVEGNANQVQRDSYGKYYLSRVDIGSYNVIIDGRQFYDQPINNSFKQYDEIRKLATGKGDNYATGCLLDYEYFLNNYRLIAIDLSKEKELDGDPRAIQQIEFIGTLPVRSDVLFVLEQSKETVLEFYKGTAKVM